jgi:hypothetical protein
MEVLLKLLSLGFYTMYYSGCVLKFWKNMLSPASSWLNWAELDAEVIGRMKCGDCIYHTMQHKHLESNHQGTILCNIPSSILISINDQLNYLRQVIQTKKGLHTWSSFGLLWSTTAIICVPFRIPYVASSLFIFNTLPLKISFILHK